MRKILRGLVLIIAASAIPGNSNAFLMDDGKYIATCSGGECHVYVKGSCEYKGFTLHLSCDLELPSDPRCTITETYGRSGEKMTEFPDSLCLPKVVIQYPYVQSCYEPEDCDKEFLCC